MLNVIAIIPARYASTRFPGKPLVDILGQSMIEMVWRAAAHAHSITHVVVATDDQRIANHCRDIGAECIVTSSEFATGTDRVSGVAKQYFPDADIVLNVQGDEPLLQSSLLDKMVDSLMNSPEADVSTPVTAITTTADLLNPTICKVLRRDDGSAMIFSRSAIPHIRGIDSEQWIEQGSKLGLVYWKHIGLYAYRKSALEIFTHLPQHPLEIAESLEQLRLLTYGLRFQCVETSDTLIAIDTPEDADIVRKYISKK